MVNTDEALPRVRRNRRGKTERETLVRRIGITRESGAFSYFCTAVLSVSTEFHR
jgi:hypothetical protein